MNEVSQKQLSSQSIKRCAVFKINLVGQFVFVDEKFEQILKTKGEQLFGKNIQNYVDAPSFDLIKTFLNSSNRFESFYESLNINFVDTDGRKHLHNVVVSLNFIAGNPVNYKIVVLPDIIINDNNSDLTDEWNINYELYEFVTNINDKIDYDELSSYFLENEKIIQVGFYRIDDKIPTLLGSRYQLNYTEQNLKMPDMKKGQIDSIISGAPYLGDGQNKYDGLTEIMLPLVCKNKSWGVIRVFYNGNIVDIRDYLKSCSEFIGNALFSCQ